MTARIRGFIYLLFLLGFLISAPLVVLYTAGYRYSFGTGRVVQTGVLSATTVPRSASIYIDGNLQSGRTPTVIDNVIPGEHEIRLERAGYSSWKKRLNIQSRSTTFIREATLFLLQEPARIRSLTIRSIAFEPNGTRVAYLAEQEEWLELWMFNTENEEATLLSRVPADPSSTAQISWSLNGTYVSAHITTAEDDLFSLIDTRNQSSTSVYSLVPLARSGYWDANQDDRFFVETPEAVFALTIGNQTVQEIPDKPDAVIGSDGGFVHVSSTNDRTVVSKMNADASTILAYIPLGSYDIHPSASGTILLEDPVRHRIILLEAAGGDQPILLNAEARLWDWENGGRRLLYSNGFDLHVYDAGEHTDETLTRVSDEIKGLRWFTPGSVVLYSQRNTISAIELDSRDGRIVTPIIDGSDLQNIWINSGGVTLYFTGTINGEAGLYKKQLQS